MRIGLERILAACGLVAAAPLSAHAQAADPTEVQLVPRSLSLEVDDPDAYVKKAANDIVNEVILTPEKFNTLLVLSYNLLFASVAQFNTTNYGTSTLFLKGGNALQYAYRTEALPYYQKWANDPVAGPYMRGMITQCDPLFGQSDIDYAVTTQWANPSQTDSRDFWLRDPTSNNEYGYQILNSLIINGMDAVRTDLLMNRTAILFQNQGSVPGKYMQELQNSFDNDNSDSFLQKWADFRAASLIWRDVPLPNVPIFQSHQFKELYGQTPTQQLFEHDELMGLNEEDEVKKYDDIRNTSLPDKVVLEGPTPQLLYSYQRNYHINSVYLTSNYSATWPSDPTIDPTHYTKFALHRLKLALPFRVQLNKVIGGNASKPFKKLLNKSFELGDRQNDMEVTGQIVKVGNVLTVGGELVDVGVDHPSAAVLGHPPVTAKDLVDMPVVIANDTFVVKAAGYEWLIRDLKDVVFDIVGMPWKKKKAEKRAGRFMCLVAPKIAQSNGLGKVSAYLTCLENADPTNIAQCTALLPDLRQYPYILDFLAGWDTKTQKYDLTNRHSLLRVMATLPATEKTAAKAYLNELRKYLPN